MSRKIFPRNTYGICEELLIILLLKNNKFEIKNLVFDEKFTIEVDNINEIKNGIQGKFWKKLAYTENCIITQRKYEGPNFDLLIIQSLMKHRFGIFIQIGVDKTISQIEKYYQNLFKNKNQFLYNLETFFQCKFDDIILMFIFDEDTQFEKYPKCGLNDCNYLGIDCLLYSFKDRALKIYNNGKYYSINGQYFYVDSLFKLYNKKKFK